MTLNLHPDDLLFFQEVKAATERVAKNYNLALRSVTPLAMPASGMADRLGDCSATGDIRLVMRATVDGEWCAAPRSPEDVWITAAHELAHLKHFNHGQGHEELTLELLEALRNQKRDHREKVIDKLVKMQAQRESEAAIGNLEAAEAFAGAINRMLIEYELNPTDLDYARATDRDPVIELRVDLDKYRIPQVKNRVAWQESLARIVAKGHLCTFLIRSGANQIWFVGTKSHASVAEYVYGILVPAAEKMSFEARHQFRAGLRKKLGIAPGKSIPASVPESRGYREAWLEGFCVRIGERLQEARDAAVREAAQRERPTDIPGAESMALIRLDGALVKVREYIDNKFKSRHRTASSLNGRTRRNDAGSAAGKAAADRMPIGGRAVTGGTVRGLIGGGR